MSGRPWNKKRFPKLRALDDLGQVNVVDPPSGFTISGVLFIDSNRDNLYTAMEPLLPAGVVVNLRDTGLVLLDTVVTDASGAYTFLNVSAGNYIIEIDLGSAAIPAGLVLGTPNNVPVTVTASNVTGINFGFDDEQFVSLNIGVSSDQANNDTPQVGHILAFGGADGQKEFLFRNDYNSRVRRTSIVTTYLDELDNVLSNKRFYPLNRSDEGKTITRRLEAQDADGNIMDVLELTASAPVTNPQGFTYHPFDERDHKYIWPMWLVPFLGEFYEPGNPASKVRKIWDAEGEIELQAYSDSNAATFNSAENGFLEGITSSRYQILKDLGTRVGYDMLYDFRHKADAPVDNIRMFDGYTVSNSTMLINRGNESINRDDSIFFNVVSSSGGRWTGKDSCLVNQWTRFQQHISLDGWWFRSKSVGGPVNAGHFEPVSNLSFQGTFETDEIGFSTNILGDVFYINMDQIDIKLLMLPKPTGSLQTEAERDALYNQPLPMI